MSHIPDDILQIRAPGLNFHVLRDAKGLCLLDGGFIGGRGLLKRALHKAGWDREPIYGIIVTHGHIDHIHNIPSIAEEHGAWIAAPRLDQRHYAGKPEYEGVAKVCGLLEATARAVLGHKPFVPDRWLEDGDELDVWHGLRVVHLPGHTAGHCGFYCERKKLLFSSDLFLSHRWWTHLPPRILNSHPEQIPASVNKALALDLEGVLPNHADMASPEMHLDRLRKIAVSLQKSG